MGLLDNILCLCMQPALEVPVGVARLAISNISELGVASQITWVGKAVDGGIGSSLAALA